MMTILYLLLTIFLSLAKATDDALQKPVLSCSSSSIPKPKLFGAEVVSIHAYVNNTFEGISGNDVCFITVSQSGGATHKRIPKFGILANPFTFESRSQSPTQA